MIRRACTAMCFAVYCCCAPWQNCSAQQYIYDYTTPVVQSGNEIKFPFAGGLNTPQFSEVDLNQDGQRDLFIFDRSGNKVLTLINEGTSGEINYRYWYDYQLLFPTMENWAVMLDYNCDGLEDILTSYDIGIKTYTAAYDGSALSYTEDIPKMQYTEATFLFDLGVGYIDVPGFADVNFDGDLDILTFNIVGGIVDYFENREIEDGLDCGTWALEHVNSCWGNFYESGITYSVDLDTECKGIASSRDGVHAGSTFMIFDEDADEDMDIVLGDLAFNNLNRLINGGDKFFAHITEQDTMYPSYDVPYNLPIFPSPFLIDVNNDNKKDMLVSPNNANISENFKNVWYYENVSDDATYVFDFQNDSLFVSDMIDVGEGAYPVFFDYNYDGLDDIVIGNVGYYNAGDYEGKLALYENSGTADAPEFSLVTRDFAGMSGFPFNYLIPTFADLDNDGDEDMLIGEDEGFVHYFKNIAPESGPAEFSLFAGNFQGLDAGANSAPQLIDVNEDGLVDLIMGEQNGNLNYYENTGTIGDPIFTLQNDLWGNVDVRKAGSLTGHSVPELVKNTSGDFTLFVGCEDGTIFQYDPTDDFSGAFTNITSAFNGIDEGSFASARFKDITSDGLNEMVTGNLRGGITLYRDETAVQIPGEETFPIAVFPNPANDIITFQSPLLNQMRSYTIFDITGRFVLSASMNVTDHISIAVNNLDEGIYIIQFKSDHQDDATIKFIKQ